MKSVYQNKTIILTTKHRKEQVLAPVFQEYLGAEIKTLEVNTDVLGTFSGEIPRADSPSMTVRKKCEWGLTQPSATYALASEGSFGSHPLIPFCAVDHEILHFIDKELGFEIQVSELTEKTNYNQTNISTTDELVKFADKVGFPSHGLIFKLSDGQVLKDFTNQDELVKAFEEVQKKSTEAISVHTDMRAHRNPTRMIAIQCCTLKLVKRLKNHCPNCGCPGWGPIEVITGLPCSICMSPSNQIKSDLLGCPKCTFKQSIERPEKYADPWLCISCNP